MDKKGKTSDPETNLRVLMKQESNSRCADCGAAKPRYASITLGIFLCNRCYGIHRSIGAHITRTKCVGLDNWSALEVQRMQSIGNAVAAAYWQQNVPSGYCIPSSISSNPVVEKWIRDKYERRLFCPAELPPPSVSNQQQHLPQLGPGNSSKNGIFSDDGWSPFITANSAGNLSVIEPSSSEEVWNPFGDVTQSNR
eukprot:Gb_02995 [translate_table: standard]